MASTPTPRNRLNKQGGGDNVGTWGDVLNGQTIELIDEMADGVVSITVNSPVTLTSVNYASDQARNRVLKFSGGGGSVTIPGVEKYYLVHNTCSGDITIKTAAGVGAIVRPSTLTIVYCDSVNCVAGTSVYPLADGTASAPSLYFASDPNTGVYRISADRIGIACGGVKIGDVNMAGLVITGQISGVTGVLGSAGYAYGLQQARLKIAYQGGDFEYGITLRPQNDNTDPLVLENTAGVVVGSIVQSTTTTTYNTSSDYRLKDAIDDIPAAASGIFIDALRPRKWVWKSNGKPASGFLAHEAMAVSPASVSGEKDAVNASGKPIYQSMQPGSSEIIANLVREVQALRARVAALEAA